jgi:hypothetical protein
LHRTSQTVRFHPHEWLRARLRQHLHLRGGGQIGYGDGRAKRRAQIRLMPGRDVMELAAGFRGRKGVGLSDRRTAGIAKSKNVLAPHRETVTDVGRSRIHGLNTLAF